MPGYLKPEILLHFCFASSQFLPLRTAEFYPSPSIAISVFNVGFSVDIPLPFQYFQQLPLQGRLKSKSRVCIFWIAFSVFIVQRLPIRVSYCSGSLFQFVLFHSIFLIRSISFLTHFLVSCRYLKHREAYCYLTSVVVSIGSALYVSLLPCEPLATQPPCPSNDYTFLSPPPRVHSRGVHLLTAETSMTEENLSESESTLGLHHASTPQLTWQHPRVRHPSTPVPACQHPHVHHPFTGGPACHHLHVHHPSKEKSGPVPACHHLYAHHLLATAPACHHLNVYSLYVPHADRRSEARSPVLWVPGAC